MLKSEVVTLETFTAAQDGEPKSAAQYVDKLMKSQLPKEAETLWIFVATFASIRRIHWKAAGRSNARAEQEMADLDSLYATCLEACISQLVISRFERLTKAIAYLGGVILAAFVVFTWAANPPKDTAKVFDASYASPLALTPQALRLFAAAHVDPACYGQGAQLVAVAASEAGPQTRFDPEPTLARSAMRCRNNACLAAHPCGCTMGRNERRLP